MDDVITLSSDSDKDDSDVEIVGSFSNIMTKTDLLPLTALRVDVGAVTSVNVPRCYIDLTDPRWTLPELKLRKTLNSSDLPLVDLTVSHLVNETELVTGNLPLDDCQKKEDVGKSQTLDKKDFNFQICSSGDPPFFAPRPDRYNSKPKLCCFDSQKQQQMQSDETHHHPPNVKLRKLSSLESHVTELETSVCYINLTKDCMQMSTTQLDSNSETTECVSNFTTSNGLHMEPSLHDFPPKWTESPFRQEQQRNSNDFTSTQLNAQISLHLRSPADSPHLNKDSSVATSKANITEDETVDFCSFTPTVCPESPSASQNGAQDFIHKEDCCPNQEQMEVDQADSRQSHLSDSLSSWSPLTGLNTSHNLMTHVDPTPTSEQTLGKITSTWQSEQVKAVETLHISDLSRCSSPSKSPSSVSKTEDIDDGSWTRTYRGDLESVSPMSLVWQQESDGEQVNEERFESDFRGASREDRHFVCPVKLQKIMSGPAQALMNEEDEGLGTPEMLCRQSLSLVYSTIDESYSEGTLQLLSDLLQPGYYPPKDITRHLLRGILLDPQSPYHLCVQAFNLLMRTQRLKQLSDCRHHMADKTTIPWDWELLTSVVANQDHPKRYRCEVVRMLLEYIVQTLEDDFQAKRSTSTLHQSIAKATLSCDQQFPYVREIIKWLFAAIMKSTEPGESKEAARERNEQIRMVSSFQRMLSLALEVDRSPALNSAKLSQELFHMLIGSIPIRAHRMLLLESLQSKLLRCKLLEHLLDYACPRKISLPMSLSLLLHFMKNCTLAPDPTDGTERWQRWEELVHLLWMLLLSYNNAMTGYLCSSVAEQKGRVGTFVYKQDDKLSRPAILEAVNAFLSRSQADLGQALPCHVDESLTYLQDYLLDVCQC